MRSYTMIQLFIQFSRSTKWCTYKLQQITTTTSTLQSAYNAAILVEFYDIANQTLRGNYLVAPENLLNVKPLELSFFAPNVS